MQRRHVLRADLPAMVGMLARSFFDDPQMAFLFPDESTRAADLGVMFTTIAASMVPQGHTYVLDDGAAGLPAASLWSPPEVPSFPDEAASPIVETVVARYGDAGIGRLVAMGEAMDAHHPHAPHLYLFIIGVEPSRQGQGLGEQLLRPMLAHCDATGTSAYLESSNPRNLDFYRRLGFETISEFHPDGGPLFTGMWRDPIG
jgi:ribosomal protein S18 acetylase RimI-like enzyme